MLRRFAIGVMLALVSSLLVAQPAAASGNVRMTVFVPSALPPQRIMTYAACGQASISQINVNWGEAAPVEAGCTTADPLLVRFVSGITLPSTETAPVTVRFFSHSDDGFHLTIGGQVVINDWSYHGFLGNYNATGTFTMTPGVTYALDAWFFDGSAAAGAILYWNVGGSQVIIPASAYTARPGSAGTNSVPIAPVLNHTANGATINLTWNAPTAAEEVAAYRIQASTNNGTWTTIGTVTGGTRAYTTSVSGSNAITRFRVAAVNAVGISPDSNVVSLGPPSAPIVTAVRTSGTSMTVTWSAAVENGYPVTGYYAVASTRICSQLDASSFKDTDASVRTATFNLQRGVRYYACVLAKSSLGNGPWGQAGPVLLADPPSAPTNLSPTDHTATSVSLSWSAASGNGSDVTAYSVQFTADGSWQTWGNVTTTSATVTGLTTGKEYQFRVAAINEIGGGEWSAVTKESASSVPAAPVLRLSEWSRTNIKIVWALPANNGAPITAAVGETSLDGVSWSNSSNLSIDANQMYNTTTLNRLTAGGKYWLRIKVQNRDGFGEWGTTPPMVATYSATEWQELANDIADHYIQIENAKNNVNTTSDTTDETAGRIIETQKQFLALQKRAKALSSKLSAICSKRPKPKGC